MSCRKIMAAVTAISCCLAKSLNSDGAENLAPLGAALMGVSSDLVGTADISVAHLGPVGEVADGVSRANLSPNGFQLDADGQLGSNGNGADTFAAGIATGAFDFVGVRFDEPQYGITSVRVQNYIANDGGWWGPATNTANGSPLLASEIAAPQLQVSFDGVAWMNLATTTNNYVSQYTGVVRGSGFPNAAAGPFATLTFPVQNGVSAIRLIGNGAGPADGNGFIGVTELEVIGAPQQLELRVDAATGLVRIVNNVQSSIRLDYYEVASAAGDLNLAGWHSLGEAADNPAGFPAGSGVGDGWEELGDSDPTFVAEGFLLGDSSIGPGEAVSLGYLATPGADDLTFRYRTATGRLVEATSTYVAGMQGDFDGDADVDGVDFLTWQRELGAAFDAADLATWRSAFGGVASVSQVAAQTVPESPAVGLMLAAMGRLLLFNRSQSFSGVSALNLG